MQLYHQACPSMAPRGAAWLSARLLIRLGLLTDRHPRRLRLTTQDVDLAVRTYRCEGCGLQLAVDMDWREGATVEPTARLD